MNTIRNLARLLPLLFVALLWNSNCFATDFAINVTFQRPAIYENASGTLRARSPSSGKRIDWVPASFQLVEVRQSSWLGPQLCGVAYTNSAGGFPAGTKFSCGNNLPNDIQLTIRGESGRGFRVGTNSPWVWEQFDVAYAYNWNTPWLKGQTTAMDFGVRRIGEPTSFTDTGFRAAALIEILDVVYQQLNLQWGLPPMYGLGSTSIWSNWIVNDVTSGLFSLSAPWTYNHTVHMPAGSETGYVLESTAHELGHAIYNLHHSGWDHYSLEVFDYMKSHETCTNYGSHFGSYEGFAHAVFSLAWRHHAESVGEASAFSSPSPTCSQTGISLEGNTDEFYSYAFAGNSMVRPAGSLNQWTTHKIGANDYAFPPTNKLWGLVATAGTSAEDLAGMWNQSMSALCSGSQLGAPVFCGSRRFKCLVKNSMLANTDSFPATFTGVDCTPGKSSIQSATIGSNGKYTVTFGASDYADKYDLEVFDNGSSTPTVYAADTSTSVGGVSLTACKASKLRVRSKLTEPASSVLGPDYAFTPNNPAWLPGTSAITSVVLDDGQAGPTTSPGGKVTHRYAVTHQTPSTAKSYRIYVTDIAGINGSPEPSHTGNQSAILLTEGKTYYLRVETTNDCGTTMGPQFSQAVSGPAPKCTRLANGKMFCEPLKQLPPERANPDIPTLAPAR